MEKQKTHIEELRENYDTIAAKCTEAAILADVQTVARLKVEKKKAFEAYTQAVRAEERAVRGK